MSSTVKPLSHAVINTNGLTNGTTTITGTGVTTDNVTVGGISIDKTAGINAGNKVISNVASGGTTATNAANIGDVQNAVANLSQNLNITDGTNNGTVDLKNQKLNVAGANGVTATVNNQTITVGLDADTVNATTKGIGLTADTGSTGNKYLKDGDVSFAVTGDGSLVSTSATAAGVKVAVNSATITAGTDGTITSPTTDGVATAKNVADAINAAKKASKTEITANTGEAANATKGNVTLTSTTAIREGAAGMHRIRDVERTVTAIGECDTVSSARITSISLGTGLAAAQLELPRGLFYDTLSEQSGFTIHDDGDLMELLSSLAHVKTEYDKVAGALEEVKSTGYGIVVPSTDELVLEEPEIVKQGGRYGVRLKASAPSIHMIRADIETEVSPIVGNEKQSEEMVNFLLQEFEGDTKAIWQSNIFGKSFHELVSEDLNGKLKRMPDETWR